MNTRTRSTLVALAVVSSLTLGSAVDAQGSAAGPDRLPDDPASVAASKLMRLDARTSTRAPARRASRLVGADGKVYDYAPEAVEGAGGNWFLGEDFDVACADGVRFKRGLKRLARLARLIERSGRRAVLVVPPNKSSVDSGELPAPRPHGKCTRVGLRDQEDRLDTFDDSRYLPLHRRLVRDRREVYYRTDTHWTSVGASVYTKRLAKRLDPKLARRQRYASGTETRLGDLFAVMGRDNEPEVAPTATPLVGVQVHPSDGDPYLQQSWRSTPTRKVLRGQALLIGDSFTYLALENLRPMFSKGRFIWTVPDHLQSMVDNIVLSDTVVLEVVQRFVSSSVIGTKSFFRMVRKALRHS